MLKYPPRLENVWYGMMSRCYNKKTPNYHLYGGRGIKICQRWWLDKDSFLDWSLENGYCRGLTIDRIDNDGDYCPENCRWATHTEQARNTRRNRWLTICGETRCLAEWAALVGLSKGVLSWRYRQGYRDEVLISPPYQLKRMKRILSLTSS